MPDKLLQTPPVPVEVVAPTPIPVEVVAGAAPTVPTHPHQSQVLDPSKPATTTFQQDLTTAGQRDINLIWETTQMKIALSVIWASLLVAVALAVLGRWLGTPDVQLAAIVFIFGVANLVTGFYFGRTNHTKVGGVGPHEEGR